MKAYVAGPDQGLDARPAETGKLTRQPGVEPQAGGRGVDTYVWESGGKTIKVFINNGKVTNKSKEGF